MDYQNSKRRYFVLLLLILNSGLCFYVMGSSLGLLVPTLAQDMQLTTVQVGALIGSISLGSMIFSFFTGPILDKFRTKVVMIITMVLLGTALIARGLSTNFNLLYVIFVLNGVLQALLNPANNKISTYWFGRKDVYMVTSFISVGQGIAGVLGYITFLPLVGLLGSWKTVYSMFGIIFIVLAVVWVFFVPSVSDKDSALNRDMKVDVEHHTFLMGVKQIFGSRQIWLIFLGTFFFFGTINLWMSLAPSVLSEIGGIELQTASSVCAVLSVGSTLGYWLCPIISQKVGLRKPFIALAFLLSCGCEALALVLPFNFMTAGLLIFIGGFMHGWAVTGPQGMLLESKEVGGINAGLAASFWFVFGKLSAVLLPMINSAFLTAGMFDNATSLAVTTSIGIIGIVPILLARETGPRAAQKVAAEK